MNFKRKRYRVLLFGIFAAGVAVPVAFAVSVDHRAPRGAVTAVAPSIGLAASIGPRGDDAGTRIDPPANVPPPTSDAAELVVVGAALVGLSAAARKAA